MHSHVGTVGLSSVRDSISRMARFQTRRGSLRLVSSLDISPLDYKTARPHSVPPDRLSVWLIPALLHAVDISKCSWLGPLPPGLLRSVCLDYSTSFTYCTGTVCDLLIATQHVTNPYLMAIGRICSLQQVRKEEKVLCKETAGR